MLLHVPVSLDGLLSLLAPCVGRCRDRLDPGSDLKARARNVAIALARSANAKLS
jgi:hypothetical protein